MAKAPKLKLLDAGSFKVPNEVRPFANQLIGALNPFLRETQTSLNGRLSPGTNLNSDIKEFTVTVPEPTWTTLQPYYGAGVSDNATSTREGLRYLITPDGRIHIRGGVTVPATNPFNFVTLPEGLRFEGITTAFIQYEETTPGPFTLIVTGTRADGLNGVLRKNSAATSLLLDFSYRLDASSQKPNKVLPYSGTGWPITAKPDIYGDTIAVIPLTAEDLTGDGTTSTSFGPVAWSYTSNKEIKITRIEGLLAGKTYKIRLLILGE